MLELSCQTLRSSESRIVGGGFTFANNLYTKDWVDKAFIFLQCFVFHFCPLIFLQHLPVLNVNILKFCLMIFLLLYSNQASHSLVNFPLSMSCICGQAHSKYWVVRIPFCAAQSNGLSTFLHLFLLSLIRTYMVQVQKQAQEQGLYPPVKWVWVKCIFGSLALPK